MSFYVDNLQVTESVEIASLENAAISSYSPVWIYNSTNALKPGTMHVLSENAYKVLNSIDANGIDIRYWINTIKTINDTKSYTNFVSIYIVYTNNSLNNSSVNYVITDAGNIVYNDDGTININSGDVATAGDLFQDNSKIYVSFFCK